jgi:spore coat-associated protein N
MSRPVAKSSSTLRRALVPLATLLAAGAITVGSGATFTSTSSHPVSSVTSGTLSHSNSAENQAIFSLTNIKPGDSVTGTLTITNTGTLPATFGLTEVSSANGFTDVARSDYLSLTITNTTTNAVVYTGTFGGLVDGAKTDLGAFQAGAANTYAFTVSLAADAPNTQQGKTASALYQWDSVQLDRTATQQTDGV